jgi:hypothetical protein
LAKPSKKEPRYHDFRWIPQFNIIRAANLIGPEIRTASDLEDKPDCYLITCDVETPLPPSIINASFIDLVKISETLLAKYSGSKI